MLGKKADTFVQQARRDCYCFGCIWLTYDILSFAHTTLSRYVSVVPAFLPCLSRTGCLLMVQYKVSRSGTVRMLPNLVTKHYTNITVYFFVAMTYLVLYNTPIVLPIQVWCHRN